MSQRYQLVAGKKLSLLDLGKACSPCVTLQLEQSVIEKAAAESVTATDSSHADGDDVATSVEQSTSKSYEDGSSFLSVDVCKTILLSRLVSLMQSTQIRMLIVKTFVDMFNGGIIPIFTSDKDANVQLIAFVSGLSSSKCYNGKSIDQTRSCIASKQITPVILTKKEFSFMQSSQFFVIGITSYILSGASNLMSCIDVVAAMSCEGAGVCTESFNPANFETRPHRALLTSATNLRMLLENSKRSNDKEKGSDDVCFAAFQTVPQVHGPAADGVAAAIKTAEIELNSFESVVARGSSSSGAFDPTLSLVALSNCITALQFVTMLSRKRTQILASKAEEIIGDASGAYELSSSEIFSKSFSDFTAALDSVSALRDSLSEELSLTFKIFNKIEQAGVTKSLGEISIDDSCKDRGGRGKEKPEADESDWTPEQRAKAEAKRKAKADKAAAKNAEKVAKKSGGAALGTGTAQTKQFLDAKCGAMKSVSDLKDTLNPFDFGEGGFCAFCVDLLEKMAVGNMKRKPKIAKGTRDYLPEQMRIREQVFSTIRRIFKRHGGVEIDTPVFELKEVLMGKYGEDSKLIYDLADQGGELLSLRYDLTVPFARFLAMNSVGNIKRFHMAKVYRRDQPQLNRGRYREFYQCDFDIAGAYAPMVPDAEVLTVATEILTELPVGNFMIKLNHRKILDSIFDICGVPAEKFRPICSAVDKLDKAPWSEVRLEMVDEKGLSPEAADKIGNFVLLSGRPMELWNKLSSEKVFGDHPVANEALADLKLLFGYLSAMGSIQHISFDLSLARGLDYYTGVIYEAVLLDGASQVGSISAGGRYDNLVGMFSSSGAHTPCVGVSIGIERVFTILEKKAEAAKVLQSSIITAYVASIGAGLIDKRMRIAKLLWSANISAEYSHLDNPKLKKQLDEVLERGIPYMVIFGPEELERGMVKVKDVRSHKESECALGDLVGTLTEMGCAVIQAGDTELLALMRG